METRINLMKYGHLNSTPCDRNKKNRLPSKTRQHQCPPPRAQRLPPLRAQTLLSRLQLMLRSGCTASVTVIVSDFYSHGKRASFFFQTYVTHFPPSLAVSSSFPHLTQETALSRRLQRSMMVWDHRGAEGNLRGNSLLALHPSWEWPLLIIQEA